MPTTTTPINCKACTNWKHNVFGGRESPKDEVLNANEAQDIFDKWNDRDASINIHKDLIKEVVNVVNNLLIFYQFLLSFCMS